MSLPRSLSPSPSLVRGCVALAVPAAVLTGCAAGPEERLEETAEALQAPASAAPGTPPAAEQCADLPASATGAYTVLDAGTATVRQDGDRVTVVEHRGANGWITQVDETTPVDVEVNFRRGFEVLQLEVERTVSGVSARVCGEN